MASRVAFVSLWNAANPNSESGYGYSMRAQLQRRYDVLDVFPLNFPGEKYWLPLRAGYRLLGQYYHPMRERSVLESLGRHIATRLDEIAPDVIFAPSSLPLSYCPTSFPWVFSTDQLFGDFLGSYIPNPSGRFVRAGEAQERQALSAAAAATFPSEAAARQAVSRYLADPKKISVITWGANLPEAPPRADIERAVAARTFDRCHLVFIGRDWERKGGPLFVETVNELNNRGIATRATIIGCNQIGLPPEYFDVHPFIDKRQPDQFRQLAEIMQSAHFFFLPSRAEAFGQAFCEASAFGLPSIGTRVGGIPTIIRHKKTGYLCAWDAEAPEIANIIGAALGEPGKYQMMALAARQDFEERLNWDKFGNDLATVLDNVIASTRSA